MAIRIVLADDNYLIREGVHRLLETQDDLEVVATCGDLESLLEAVEAERPDVILTDIRMPPGGGGVAERLVLSRRTVDHHVSAILRKLSVKTRGEATHAAAELGLLQDR